MLTALSLSGQKMLVMLAIMSLIVIYPSLNPGLNQIKSVFIHTKIHVTIALHFYSLLIVEQELSTNPFGVLLWVPEQE